MGAARLERRRATPAARELARTARGRGAAAPVGGALTLLAFFAEEAGGPPPEALARAEGWAATLGAAPRARWPEAPELPRLLARLPAPPRARRARAGRGVVAGVQLAEPELLAGVRIALERDAVAGLAREVLAALGPEEACELRRARARAAPAAHARPRRAARARLRGVRRDPAELLALRRGRRPRGARAARAPARARRRGDGAARRDHHRVPDAARRAGAAHRGRAPARFADLYLAPYEVDLTPDASSVGSARGGPLRRPRPCPCERSSASRSSRRGRLRRQLARLLRTASSVASGRRTVRGFDLSLDCVECAAAESEALTGDGRRHADVRSAASTQPGPRGARERAGSATRSRLHRSSEAADVPPAEGSMKRFAVVLGALVAGCPHRLLPAPVRDRARQPVLRLHVAPDAGGPRARARVLRGSARRRRRRARTARRDGLRASGRPRLRGHGRERVSGHVRPPRHLAAPRRPATRRFGVPGAPVFETQPGSTLYDSITERRRCGTLFR